jgi:glycosyltransferase involved in cell wall biosynthesis
LSNQRLTFSIIICTKNREKHLRKCLESVLHSLEKYPLHTYEIIVVDVVKESKNSIPNMLKELGSLRNVELNYFNQDKTGLPNARNFGIGKARGKIIVFLDDDVSISSEYFTNLEHVFSIDPHIGGVSGPYQKSLEVHSTLKKLKTSTDRLFLGGCAGENGPIGKVLRSGFTTSNFEFVAKLEDVDRLTGCNMAFSEKAMKNLFFDENYLGGAGIGEDADYSYRVKKAGFRLIVDSDLKVFHEDVDDKIFPYSNSLMYFFGLNQCYFFFNEVYSGKASAITNFMIGAIYYSILHIIGGTICSRPSTGISYFRGLLAGLFSKNIVRG